MSAMRRIATALFLALSTTAVVGALGAVGASAAPYTGGATLAISDACVGNGASPTLTGAGFVASSTVSVTVGGDTLGTATTDSSGAFSASFAFPSLTGTQTVTASGSGVSATVSVDFSCTAGQSTGSSNTGVEILTLLLIAGALLAGGVVATTIGRRRKVDA